MKLKVVLVILVVVAAGGGLAATMLGGRPDAVAPAATVDPRRGALVELATATGTIEPDVLVEVKPRQAAGEVVDVLVEEGQQVAAGDVLVRLDPTEREENLRDAEAALAAAEAKRAQAVASHEVARAQAKEAEAHADVRKRGATMGLLPSEDRRVAESGASVARANVRLRAAEVVGAEVAIEQARLHVATAKRLLDEMTIRAPLAGTLLTVDVEKGSVVTPAMTHMSGGTAVATIADLTTLLVVGRLDEAQIGRVALGQDVTIRVDAWPDRTFAGRVQRISPRGEEESTVVTFDIDITVTDDDAHLLRSGMSADIEIVVARHEGVLLLPVAALRSEGHARYVELAAGGRRALRTGATDGTDIVVLEGLAEGEAVLLAGASAKAAGGPPGPFGMRPPR